MTTMAHMAATLALLWLSMEFWTTFDERLLGVASLGLALVYLLLTFYEAIRDWQWLSGEGYG